jgi:hypothetical protein
MTFRKHEYDRRKKTTYTHASRKIMHDPVQKYAS